ncbi:MAG: hypothetical protein RL701_7340, partial [Pseudomonadota bacterium]
MSVSTKLPPKLVLPVFAWLALLTFYYTFVATAGTFVLTDWQTDYYDLMVSGWQKGHLYLTVEPLPSLLERKDPFNHDYSDDWLWDASLFKGRYYLYWGPVPGLCLWVFKAITNTKAVIRDQWLVLFFMLMRLYAGSALIIA